MRIKKHEEIIWFNVYFHSKCFHIPNLMGYNVLDEQYFTLRDTYSDLICNSISLKEIDKIDVVFQNENTFKFTTMSINCFL